MENIEYLREYKSRILQDKGIWNLFDGVSQAFEKEYMLAQTVCASVTNYDENGEAFSIKGNVNNSAENSHSYHWLCEHGYFQETERMIGGISKRVIVLTEKTIAALRNHYA